MNSHPLNVLVSLFIQLRFILGKLWVHLVPSSIWKLDGGQVFLQFTLRMLIDVRESSIEPAVNVLLRIVFVSREERLASSHDRWL